MTATIGATHVLCSIGNGTEQVWASARAGVAQIVSSHVMDRHFDAIQMGLVPEDALAPLIPEIDVLPLPSRARRMLRLAAPSLRSVGTGLGQPVPVFVGVPDLAVDEAPWLRDLPAHLGRLSDVQVDLDRSAVVPRGRAAALIALSHALDLLRSEPSRVVIVGGVDSYLDLRLLASLDSEQRILGPRVMDGFIPGEGSAFYLLAGPDATNAPAGPRVVVHAAASTKDPGHRYGDAPARGEGLALALEKARQQLDASMPPMATTFAGFNGESFDAKLWGVARLRHNDFFSPGMVIEHPADKYGDAGAATGAILVALAAKALESGTRQGPALVWAASDREPRACALMSVATN
jgi:3-oxoacyl-[acyl-carrier-protein] synthase-1